MIYLLILSAKLVHFEQKDKFLKLILQSTNTLSAKWKKWMNSPFYRYYVGSKNSAFKSTTNLLYFISVAFCLI